MGLIQVTQPAVEPLTIAEVKRHLRIEDSYGELSPGILTAALGTGAGNVDNGDHRYVVTFVTVDGETEAGSVSAIVTVADKTVNGKISLSNIQIGGSQVTARKIYRTKAGGVTFLLLATINDNITTVYADNVADSTLGAGAPSLNSTVDPYLTALIITARMTCEDITKQKFITQQWQQVIDNWPTVAPGEPRSRAGAFIDVMLPPLQSIDSISYFDTTGAEQTLSTDVYQVSVSGYRARVALKFNQIWPYTAYRMLDAITLNMTVGYGDSGDDIPAPIKHAMLLMIGHWYNQREDVIVGMVATEVPKAASYLLSPYTSMEF